MKTTMKKLASAALALVLALCLAAPAFAAGEDTTPTGSITIEKAPYGQEYKIYRVFDLESYVTGEPQDKQAHSYKTNDTWADFVAGGAPGAAYVTVDDQGYVTWNENADAAAFAAAALAWAKEKNIAADGTATTEALPEGKDPAAMDATATVGNLSLGYYLVASSVGALCSLDPTNQNATVHEKNTLPTLDKEIVPPELGENAPGVGDSVNYKITVNAKANVKENYVVHDTMGTGLTFNDDVAIEGLTEGTDYDVITSTTDGCTFEVVFTDAFKAALTEDKTIVITYSATINAAALTVDKLNNKAHLNYGDPNHTLNTTEKTVDVDLYQFDLVKTNSDDMGKEVLTGAEFNLYNVAEGGDAIALVLVEDAENGNYYRPATTEDATTTTDIKAGVATIKGLGAGTYYLEETKAPEGYNKLNGRTSVEVGEGKDWTATIIPGTEANGDTPATPATWERGGVRVVNLTGAELPSTGGIGTTIFYIVGGLLAVGAGVLLVTKKKMGADEE